MLCATMAPKSSSFDSRELRESIKSRLRSVNGFYFFHKNPMTTSEQHDDDLIDCLSAGFQSGPVAAENSLAHLMLQSNNAWDILLKTGPNAYWMAVSQTQIPKLGADDTRDLVLAFVKARDRYLRCFPQKSPQDVDSMLAAYTQHLLQKFEALGKMEVLGFPICWRLTRQEIKATEGFRPQGPIKQISKNKFELSPCAQNLLVPARCLSPVGKFKSNLMGLAAEIIQQPRQCTPPR